MRQSFQWQPARTKRKNLNTVDLVTKSETTLASENSQDWSQGSRNMTQRTTLNRDLNDYDDMIVEEGSQILITAEEQDLVRGIFELARKNKINQQNAFDIPLIVANPGLACDENAKFWKFASELLHTSSTIYDKRVENLALETDKLSGKMTRVNSNSEQPSTKNKSKRRTELIVIDQIEEDFDLRTVHTLEFDKVNLRDTKEFRNGDHLFSKRLQAFDNNQLSGMFLNQFDVSSGLEIKFFQYDRPSNYFEDQSFSNKGIDPLYVNDIQKNKVSLNNCFIFEQIGRFSRQSLPQEQRQAQHQYEEYEQMYGSIQEFMMRHEERNISRDLGEQAINNLSASCIDQSTNLFNLDKSFFNSFHNDDEQPILENQSKNISGTVLKENSIFQIQCAQTTMIPWEIEFKGLQINRIKKKSSSAVVKREKLKRQKNWSTNFDIDFLNQEMVQRKTILMAQEENDSSRRRSIKNINNNIRPKDIQPSLRTIGNKSRAYASATASYLPTPFQASPRPQTWADHAQIRSNIFADVSSILPLNQGQQITQSEPSEVSQFHQMLEALSTEGLMNFKTFGRLNMREVKEEIYKEVYERGSIRLSEAIEATNLSPGSAFIVFLHLANQWQMDLQEVGSGQDVILSIPK